MVFAWLFPQRCVGCQKEGSYLCPSCQKKLQPAQAYWQTSRYLNGLTAILKYNFIVRGLIHKLKYRFIPQIAEVLTKQVLKVIKTEPRFRFFKSQLKNKQPFVIPVPLHWWRFNWRGFNQAEQLAGCLAKEWQLPLKTKLLERNRFTWAQVKLSRKQRQKNIFKAFQVCQPEQVKEKNILLIDDVWTTGATMKSAAMSLKKAGADWVWGLTIAR